MNSKPTTSVLVALCAAVLVVPLLAAGGASAVTSAFQPAGIAHPGDNDGANLYQDPTTFVDGQGIKLTANFPDSSAGQLVTIYKETSPGSNDYAATSTTDEANSQGNAYMYDYEVNGDQRIFARSANGDVTEVDPLEPAEGSALLDPNFQPVNGGADARAFATFVPADEGADAVLQVRTINDPRWKTIERDAQDSNGKLSFFISDPLEVEHQYRAVSNGVATTNNVTWSGPLLDKNTGLPTVHFNSNDGESVNTRSTWFDGEFTIKGGDGCESVATFDEAKMRGRGNYSWSFAKKGFNLKFEDKKDLCDMGNSEKWALVANHYDRSLLRNTVANEVGDIFDNLTYTPNDAAVDLYVNGSYRGSYILIERVNFEGGRLDYPELKAEDNPADISGSYLFEWDFRKGADNNFTAGSRGWVGLKEPEDEDYTSAFGNYANNALDRADRDLFDGSINDDDWKQWIDIDTAVDYYLAMEYLKPVDGNMWASVYMYKPLGGKIEFGPLWDFDLAMGSADRAGNVVSPQSWYLRNPINISARQTPETWFNRLNEIPDFRNAARARWSQIEGELDALEGYVNGKRNLIADSAEENYNKWSHGSKISKYQVIKSSWNADVDYLNDWLNARHCWMERELGSGAC